MLVPEAFWLYAGAPALHSNLLVLRSAFATDGYALYTAKERLNAELVNSNEKQIKSDV